MRIFGFLDQKRSKKNLILSQNFDCYGVIKELFQAETLATTAAARPASFEIGFSLGDVRHLYDPIAVKILRQN